MAEHQAAVAAMIAKRTKIREEMGGAARMAKLAADGVPNARQRIEALLDPGSFEEVGHVRPLRARRRRRLDAG